jgi:hypothetical protein
MKSNMQLFRNSAKLLLVVSILLLTSCHLSDNQAKMNELEQKR